MNQSLQSDLPHRYCPAALVGFLDARDFFAKDLGPEGEPPASGLWYTVGLLPGGVILAKPSCSLSQLLPVTP